MMQLLSGAVLAACAVGVEGYVSTGQFENLIPFAVSQEVDMKVNGDWMSGIAEEYVSVRLDI
jgi:hypothetical protein